MIEREFAIDVVRKLRAAGHQALWAGGCVRDQLMGLEPHDYDVATDARPEQVQALFRRTIAVGISFGVVEVLGPKPLRVQVATFRSDGTYDDGRHPTTVTFSSPEEDAKRRDFTINGLFFDPIADQVIDYVGGEADLKAGIIRAIGDPRRRFTEDKLRLIRAVRFAARFGFTIEPVTASAIREMASQINAVAAERIADELRKILTDPHRAAGMTLVRDLSLGSATFPGVELCLNMLSALDEPVSFPLGLAAIVHTVDSKMAAKLCDRLRLSNDEKDRVVWLVANQSSLNHAPRLAKSTLKPILARTGIRELLALHRALARSAGRSVEHVEFCERCLRDWPRDVIDPPPLITGDDLTAMGLTPGKQFKTLLDAVRRAQLDEKISSREEAMQLVTASR
jgi:tRNA nucleotidyltransferase/poly(A) polymerase